MVYNETAAVALVYNRMNVAAAVALCVSAICMPFTARLAVTTGGPAQLLTTLI